MSLTPQPADIDSFRWALGSAAATVNVITVREPDGRPSGMTATAFSSVSTDPLLILVCVNRRNRSYHRMLRTGSFGVNILSQRAQHISVFCAQPGSDKALKDEWLVDQGRQWAAPALGDALAFLDCEVYRHVPAGTHAVIIGAVRGVGAYDGADRSASEPLVYHRGDYHGLVPISEVSPMAISA